MSLNLSITAGLTTTSGPFPPNYAAGAVGFIKALSNPGAELKGTCSPGTYFGAQILAVCSNLGSPNTTEFMVALAGSYDQTFLGNVSFTGYNGAVNLVTSQASYLQQAVGAQMITLWIWQLPNNGMANGQNYTVTIQDTPDLDITLVAIVPSSTEIELTWSDSILTATGYELWRGVSGAVPTLYQTLGAVFAYNDLGLAATTQYQYYVRGINADGTHYLSNTMTATTPASGISAQFNCNCETIPAIPGNATLGALRKRLAIRLGYAAQAANLPPGAKDLFNEFLISAQNQAYRAYREKRIKRYYAWQMVINQRYYGLANDESGCRSISSLDIDWVGFEDLNQAWYPLIEGIDPVMYTRAQISTGWPTHYDIRSCIEIFPAPKAAYTLWARGPFNLDPFVADTDYPTIDSELVYMLAVGLGKTHYAQPDAGACMTQAANYMRDIVASSHRTARYVPRTRQNTLLTPPLFLPTLGE